MKILAIRGKNLASFDGEFKIDFTKEPLKSTGLYAITGPTGAGKSTILDALCLALFDNSPRFSKAEKLNKEELKFLDDKISPNHCGNILRKGTGYGYAEVNFIALNGDYYRSRWVVRRAHDKYDGTIRSTSIQLKNITANTEEEGTKRDLLNKIKLLIGLSFEQFTRAVLLAQGEFANFLKAKPNEKAELLEKLTGTEIYSQVSKVVYQKAKVAESDLDKIKTRINDIHLLSEEQYEDLNRKRKELQQTVKPLNEEILVLKKKLEWIEKNEFLQKDVDRCKQRLDEINFLISEAAPRYQYLSLIDKCQEIRDVYKELQTAKSQLKSLTIEILHMENQLKSVVKESEQIKTAFKCSADSLNNINKKIKSLAPDIDKAKSLDIYIDTFSKQLEEKIKSVETEKNKLESTGEFLLVLQKNRSGDQNRFDEVKQWLSANSDYVKIASSKDSIIAFADSFQNAEEKKNTFSKKLDSVTKLLEKNKKNRIKYEIELLRLEKLLPSEILHIRNRLVPGEPCPVCGSEHHPLKQVEQEDSFKEEELEYKKNIVKESLELCLQNIQFNENAVTEYKTRLETEEAQSRYAFGELKKLLFVIPGWEKLLNENSLRQRIIDITSEWSEKKNTEMVLSQKIDKYTAQIDCEEKNFVHYKERLQFLENTRNEAERVLLKQKGLRRDLLDGRSVAEVENELSVMQNRYSLEYENFRKKKENAENEISRLSGVLSRLISDKKNKEMQVGTLDGEVEKWLNKHDSLDKMSFEDLMDKTSSWILTERKYLEELSRQQSSIEATLKEKSFRLEEHKSMPVRPADDESESGLSALLQDREKEKESIREEIIRLEVELGTHERNKKQIEGLEKEREEKKSVYSNWDKLNLLIGSHDGNKFKTIAQGYTMDVLLSYANKHLEELSRRYQLEKIPETLSLRVVDNDMFGQVRTVHSLSGGESFLISLALALGLSSLSSNRMKIESLFIDEGFGALDIETLGIAMDALDALQSQGRKIGVISHVEEMKERITTQIQVVKRSNGNSFIRIRT